MSETADYGGQPKRLPRSGLSDRVEGVKKMGVVGVWWMQRAKGQDGNKASLGRDKNELGGSRGMTSPPPAYFDPVRSITFDFHLHLHLPQGHWAHNISAWSVNISRPLHIFLLLLDFLNL